MAEKQIKYSEMDRAITAALANASEGLTGAQLSEVTGLEVKPGHTTSAINKGLIKVIGKTSVPKVTHRKVFTYTFVDAVRRNKEDGKPFNYTDGELSILATASQMESPFTLIDLAAAMGVEVVRPGSVSGLIKKGNLTKCAEEDKVTVEGVSHSEVNVYGFVRNVE